MNPGSAHWTPQQQPVQMNPGSGHGMPQQQPVMPQQQPGMPQQQQTQAASGQTSADRFKAMRIRMLQRIVSIIAKQRSLSSMTPEVLHYARRVEDVLHKTYPTMAGYYAMITGQQNGPLNHAFQTVIAENRRRQQLAGQVASGSSYGTMIPTPGMAQSANVNSAASHLMDTRFTGGNSNTGSMYNGHQNPSTNIPGGIPVGTTSEGMQRPSHMIPTPGFSNHPTSLPNSEYPSGAGCLNVESNIAPQMQHQEKPFGSNQGYQMQHLGSLAVSTVHSNILDKSSYGSSDAKMNGGMGIHSSNMQPINRTTGSQVCANLAPYGNRPLQQQFDAPLPQKSPSTSDHHMKAQVLTPPDKAQHYSCQRKMVQDGGQQPVSSDGHIVGCTVTSLDSKLSNLSTKEDKHESANTNDEINQLRWLLMLKHAEHCVAPVGSCKSQHCARVQEIVKHFRHCQTKNCSYRYCVQSKKLSCHYKNCINEQCTLCSKAKIRLRRSSEQAHKNSPDDHILIAKQSAVQRITNGALEDKMDIDLVRVETTDEQPLAPKRLKLHHVSPNASKNGHGIPYVSVHEPKPVLQEQKNNMLPKRQASLRVDTQHPVNPIGHGIDGKVSVVKNNMMPHVKQENVLADKDKNENFLDLKNKTNGRMDVTVSKSGKPKIKGVSLTELFTPEQIKEHTDSLKQWVGQSKAKVEMNQAMEHSDSACQLCEVTTLNFEPPPIYCSSCGVRIKRNALYYTAPTAETCHNFCLSCFNARSQTIQVEGNQFPKAKLVRKKNDEDTEEAWVMCDKCERWQHQICALFNCKRNESGEAEYTCPKCYVWEIEHGLRMPLPQSAVLGAKDLPRTVLSDHIEGRLFKRLREERQERATRDGKSFDEVCGADGLVVRVVSSVDKKLEVKPRFFEIFQEDKYPAEFPYKSKAILLFQKIEGVEVCLFGMYVQEYGAECADPNQRRVYLSYLDSVKFFRPEVKTVSGEALRTYVYHEILIGYLEYCKQRGFTSCYIWACPPLKGEDYILYCHPEIQKTPRSDLLREWYLSMLRKATKERIVVETTNLYDHFFITTKECKAKVTAARLPYFDGDYWPGTAEDMINQYFVEEDDRKLQRKGKVKKTITKRALRAAGQTDLCGNASKDAILMQKLGETIYPMKEDFIMVHLQHSCSHCSTLMVAGKRWVCRQCKSFYICDSCYDAEQQLDEKERHPSNSRDSHVLHPVDIVGVPKDTKDRDDIIECEFFDTRQAFLSLCQGNRYQHETLRRAKHSSMMILYHLHNPTAPAFVISCNICKLDIETGQGWRCEECPEFDVCAACYEKDRGGNHRHKLTNQPSSAGAQSKEARKMRVQQARVMLDLLVHAQACRTTGCQYKNCRRIKGLFNHAGKCPKRASGGCKACMKMWSLLHFHARACKELKCDVPRCRDLKDIIRRSQQQAETRRRAAVNEMMRERAAEAAKRR
ncbi:probable histone acetyltransferase HAC-like 1 [Lolium rigidum]|uniref:probable histone acetyltransferase HAC-like 1 n=1 Tax=Lolium rigidum TaxID=89674 RepID=UPI001F5CB13A|nr:probable histone acetyltransferase HAC-like 1 [Lolium rigidum]